MIEAEDGAFAFNERQIFVLMCFENLKVFRRASDIHQHLADVVQQSAGKGNFRGNLAMVLGEGLRTGCDTDRMAPEHAGVKAIAADVIAIGKCRGKDDFHDPVCAQDQKCLFG